MLPRGIEPRSDALQAPAMTTSAKAALVPRWRIELPYPPCKDGVLPLNYRGIEFVVGRDTTLLVCASMFNVTFAIPQRRLPMYQT